MKTKITFSINRTKLKELLRIAKSKGKPLEFCLQQAIREYIMFEKQVQEQINQLDI